jgi:hypothetical protein
MKIDVPDDDRGVLDGMLAPSPRRSSIDMRPGM